MLDLAELLPLRSAIVTLRFLEAAAPPFFHQPALAAFLRHLAGSPEHFERLIRFDTPESGRIAYRPGQHYRFTVLCLAGGAPLLATLLPNLAGLPASRRPADGPMPFRDNCALAALHDAFGGRPVTDFEDLSAYDFETLCREAELWRGYGKLAWQFLAPARLLKDKARRGDARGEARYCRNLADVDGALLAGRLHDSLAELLEAGGGTRSPRPAAPPVAIAAGHLFWLDAGYTDGAGKDHVMGGMTGRLDLAFPAPPPAEWLRQAILGQYVGIGQRGAFGFGRYRLESPEAGFSARRALPATSLLALAGEESNLVLAFKHIRANRAEPPPAVPDAEAPPWDFGEEPPFPDEPEIPDELPLDRLREALERAANGRYEPPPLFGLIADKADGGIRPLAVPPFFDRVLQRAVAQVVAPALDAAQYRHSYGFRPGRSRRNARDAIQAAAREGYGWVYESDVADFFDSVDRGRLEVRLRSLFGEDPVVDPVLAWMARPVEYEGQLIARAAGLPQGSPLSPGLANLMLDDFDSDMEALGFRLIRFADDFVVLCKDPEQAERAHRAATESLAEHGLCLNPDKTRIVPADQGFRFLGYLFVNELAVDVAGHGAETPGPPEIPPHSWLARLGERAPARMTEAPRAGASARVAGATASAPSQGEPARAENAAPAGIGEMDGRGQLLCVTGDHATLSTRAGRLRVERGEQLLFDPPWHHLQAVVLFGTHTLTTPALHAALKERVPIHFAGSTGAYRGVLWTGQPAEPGCGLWLKQANLFADPNLTLVLAREIVAARIRHLRETLRLRGAMEAATRLKAPLNAVDRATSLEQLNGLEGEATRAFFQAVEAWLPVEWSFSGRNRQPPRDPFNALLSFGYSLLHGCVETLLHADGLLPWLGFYHQAHGRHATLASDLMEPFRHLVERVALTSVQRRELAPRDFFIAADGACLLRKEARHTYLRRLLERLNDPLAAADESGPVDPLRHIHKQNLSLIGWLTHGEVFRAWRTR